MVNKKNKGQSTIEFIMTFTMVFAFFFLFLKMALNYTDGYLVHYATFIASRAYLTVDNDNQTTDAGAGDGIALRYARKVFDTARVPLFITGFNSAPEANDPSKSFQVYTGIYTNYSTAFALGIVGGQEKMDLRSESFLGREPGRFETYEQTCNAIKTVTGRSCDIHATLDDNGG
jgi:hypothetical protein